MKKNKVSLRERFIARADERIKLSERAFDNTKKEAKIWWDGYNSAMQTFKSEVLTK